MKKYIFIILGVLLIPTFTSAVDSPHDPTNSIYCGECHVPHATLGDVLINATDSLVGTLCLSCHTPGGWTGMAKVLSSSQKADPGVSGSSHNWNVPAVNSDRGAQLPTSQVLLDHLTGENKITCATCHDPHANTQSPFLRLDNAADALCYDCHAPRKVRSVRTYTGNHQSHPVDTTFPGGGLFHNPPLDVDGSAQPSDGNTTNDFTFGAGSTMKCTTCHGVHYTDSNSGTVDGP